MDPPPMSSEELVLPDDDDCFTCNILKRRRRISDPSAGAKAEVSRRRQKKKTTLLKLKSEYRKEIGHWELSSNNLRSLQNRATQRLELQNQVEAQEAIMDDESMGKTQQEQLAESFFDLAIWSSPNELMASLCYE